MSTYIKKVLFILIIAGLSLPLLQHHTSFFKERGLNGYYENSFSEVNWGLSSWLNTSYQKQFNGYYRENVGFKSSLIRLYNQIQYSLYKKVTTNEVIVGKNNILYDERHINTLMGYDFIGKDIIQKKVALIKKIRDSLQKDGKQLVIVIAPNKARYFEQEIPSSYKKEQQTNYEVYIKQLEHYKIDYIDFNKWFVEQKNVSDVNLIPKYGIHWSDYSCFLVMDSIINHLNKKYQYNLPRYEILEEEQTTIPSDLDYDLGNSLNLLLKPTDEKYIYPKISFVKGDKKRLLAIGDSYFLALYLKNFLTSIFDLNGFWYYNKEVTNESRKKDENELKRVLPESDIIIVMATEWNLYRLGYGIFDEINSYYTGKQIETPEVRHYINKIRTDKEWMKDIRKKAKKRGITIEEMIVKDAKYFVRNKNK